ncbi:MAG: NDP-sugar synthase [Candidatus Baltobacteraceae bacterium]
MILAGGMSTRLYPLTRAVPKPLVPVAGEPNSAHVMRYLHSFGIDEIAINVHYLADAIETCFGDGSAYGVKLHYLREAILMGSAGAIKPLESFFDETFVVVGCDDLTNAPLDRLVAFHRERKALATIGLVKANDVREYGVVVLDERGRIVEFQEKPAPGTERSHLVNTGIYVFEPAIFSRIPADTFYDFGKNVFPGLQADAAPFYGLAMPDAYWSDIGTPGEYRRATFDVLAGRMRLPGGRPGRGIAPDAVIDPSVRVEGDVLVGAGVRIGAGARIAGPCAIGEAAVVGAGATLERSIVWARATIGAGATLRDSIVGQDYAVPPHATLDGDVVANNPETVPA